MTIFSHYLFQIKFDFAKNYKSQLLILMIYLSVEIIYRRNKITIIKLSLVNK